MSPHKLVLKICPDRFFEHMGGENKIVLALWKFQEHLNLTNQNLTKTCAKGTKK